MRDGVSLTMAPEAFEAAILPLVTKIVTEMIGKNDRPEWLTIDEAAKRIGLLPGAARALGQVRTRSVRHQQPPRGSGSV